jgi:hypothetical protein
MHDESSLSLQFESCGKQRQSGRSSGAFDRHSQKSSWFIEDHHGIVFVKHGKLRRETRLKTDPAFLNGGPLFENVSSFAT